MDRNEEMFAINQHDCAKGKYLRRVKHTKGKRNNKRINLNIINNVNNDKMFISKDNDMIIEINKKPHYSLPDVFEERNG
jgi:hypothetical protein